MDRINKLYRSCSPTFCIRETITVTSSPKQTIKTSPIINSSELIVEKEVEEEVSLSLMTEKSNYKKVFVRII
jgi:hypothetical protein